MIISIAIINIVIKKPDVDNAEGKYQLVRKLEISVVIITMIGDNKDNNNE